MFFKSGFVTAVSLAASLVDAHMIMHTPHPYGEDSLTNSPLAADGSDFPCKLRPGVFNPPKSKNIMPIGAPQQLTFKGSATHGGGSCQLSLTTEKEPKKDTKWMVIKSYEGGCPADTTGNLQGGPNSLDPYKFNYTIPEGIKPGDYTLAWTWFNRIGNREMYMNCAPITVTGGSGKRDDDANEGEGEGEESSSGNNVEKRDGAEFPPMFVANVNGCTTPESKDVRFPNPGKYVDRLGKPQQLAPEGQPACHGKPTFQGEGIKPNAGGSSPTGVTTGGGASATSGGSGSTQTSGGGGNGNGNGNAAASSSPAAGGGASPTTSQGSGASSTPTSGGSSGGGSGGGGGEAKCDTEGDWNCIAGSSFQRCASGKWTKPQQLASGTRCNAGQSKELKIEPEPEPSPSSSNLKARNLTSAMRQHRRRMFHHEVHQS